jgi:hypothetical protein
MIVIERDNDLIHNHFHLHFHRQLLELSKIERTNVTKKRIQLYLPGMSIFSIVGYNVGYSGDS